MVKSDSMRFAEVAVDIPTKPGRTFSYRIPSELNISPGQLLRVPFGARTLQGIVFSLAEHSQVAEAETKDIESVVFEEPLLDNKRLQLALWISEYYICSLFEAAAPMLPPGGRVRARTYLTLAEADTDHERLTTLQQRIVQYISKRGAVSQDALVNALGDGANSSVAGLIRRHIVNRDYSLPDPSIKRKYRTMAALEPNSLPEIQEWLSIPRMQATKQSALIERLRQDDKLADITQLRREFGASAVRTLTSKGWLTTKTLPIDRDPLDGRVFPHTRPPTPTAEQSEAVAAIRSALRRPSSVKSAFVIEGITGSGKTEVYLQAAKHCIQLNKQAIILVPEIALTYQTIERFASRFPGKVAILHSGLSDGERFDQWWKIRRGGYNIIIGSRSAVFAPVPDLGLIVIDEEHEWTYKQHDAAPRYHARQVSMKLSDLTQSVVVLGSASPDIGTYYDGLRKRHSLYKLTERFADTESDDTVRRSTLPSVTIVDMREELRNGNTNIFSRALSASLKGCLESEQQAMLFLNRRGTSSHLRCFSCGYNLRCRSCDVGVTYHASSQRFICHYCGARRRPPRMCPQCLRYRLRYYGIGTEAVEEEVLARFPGVGVLRLDRDIATGPKSHEDLLTRFRSGEAQVLVGTQMIAKGLHFPSVSLVGVVSADVGLAIPDYRAGERAFQLLYQVAGRAGRGSFEGKAIIQTFQPDHYAIQSAAAQNYHAFYLRETAHRRERRNPPYSRLIRLLHTHTNQAKCEAEAARLAAQLHERQAEWDITDVEILGPMPAFPGRLRGRYRWHIILRGASPRRLLDKVDVHKGWSIDIDPVALT